MKAKFIMMLALQAEAMHYRTLQRELEDVVYEMQIKNNGAAIWLLENYIKVAQRRLGECTPTMHEYYNLHIVIYRTVLALLRGEA